MQRTMLSLALAALLTSAAQAGDWTYWRGPEHDGICRETGLIDDWALKSEKNVLWKSDIGGRATPVVLNGRVYLNCRTDDDVNDPETKVNAREQVVCWDAKTGKELWKDVFNVFQTDIAAPRVGWASMTGDAETGFVYMHSVSGLFRCYDKDGNVQWEHSLFEDMAKIAGYGGRTTTPIVDEDRVIISFFALSWGSYAKPPPKQTFYAFDKKTGKLLWRAPVGGKPLDTNYSNPVIRVINGQRQLICGGNDGGVHALNARTGQPIWSFKMSKRGLNASPAVEGNLVFMSHGEDNVDNVKFGRIQCIDATGTGDVTETKSVWRIDGIKAGYTGLLVKDGILYVVADTGNMYAYDSKSGKPLWTHNLGTVGKGSPVWADGKIYVMEVNGNVHILKPSREGCETLSHVQVAARVGEGMDEIYASPAIANGRIYLVTRDRTLCLGSGEENGSEPVPPPGDEGQAGEIALLRVSPADSQIFAGDKIQFEVRAYDEKGRFVKNVEPESIEIVGLRPASTDGTTLSFAADAPSQQGIVNVIVGDLSATTGLRVVAPLPWKFDFEGLAGPAVPPTWINAQNRIKPFEDKGGNTVMRNAGGRGRPSTYMWIGPSTMKGYTIQADVRMTEARRQMPNVGITAHRYNLIIKGNRQRVTVQSWAPHLRMATDVKFRSDPDKWYTMKLKVEVKDDGAHVMGKVWERGTDEPAEWTIETVDPNPNLNGAPGLYTYALAPSDFDNVLVTKE